MQLCCHAAAKIKMHILWAKMANNAAMLPCSYGTWQTCIYYGPRQQAMQLCCHAAAELNKHTYIFIIMGQSGKQCSYVAVQQWNLTNMHICGQSRKQCSYVAVQLQNLGNMHIWMRHMSSWVTMQLQNLLASYLNKHIVQHMQPCHHAAAESNKHEYNMGHLGKQCRESALL